MPAIESDIHITVRAGGKSFSIGGVRASQGIGKAEALRRMLAWMERDWIESFPGAKRVA